MVGQAQGNMKFIPLIDTIKSYRPDLARDDLTAALTVAIMLVPQSLAYAMLANLPPEIGLYSSILPLVLYALFGTSSSLAVGPVAIVALMTGATIADISKTQAYSPVEISITLAFLSGLIMTVMGIFRMGFIVNFISRSVTEGFIFASAILIALSQFKYIFSIDMSGQTLNQMIHSLHGNVQAVHWPTLILGGGVLMIMFLVKPVLKILGQRFSISSRWLEFIPRMVPTIMVVLTILLMHFTAFGRMDINTVGSIPNGLPDFTMFTTDKNLFRILLLPAFLISIIGYIESISIASRFAAKTRSSIDSNSELIGLGAANLGSGFSGGMPVTGGLARSATSFNAGSRTQLSGLFSAIFMGIFVSGLMGFMEQLPKATLAATIIVAIIGLIDVKKLKETWNYSRSDSFLMIITIIMTLFYGVEVGISTGIILSIMVHLYLTSKPHMAIIGLIPGTQQFRNVLRYEVETVPEIIGIRIDESLYFANASFLEHEIVNIVIKNELIEHCILMFSSISDIDASALESLENINSQLKDLGITLHFSEVKGPVMDKLKRSHLYKEMKGRIHMSHYQAVQSLSKAYDDHKAESDVYETNMNPINH